MSDSTSLLDLIAVGASDKEGKANALFDAASPAAMFGRRASTCTGLTWGYYGGRYYSDLIANGTLTLAANQTNYIVAAAADGTVSSSVSDTNWDDTDNYIRLYIVETGASLVESYEDHRQAIFAGAAPVVEGSGSLFSSVDYLDTLTTIPMTLDQSINY